MTTQTEENGTTAKNIEITEDFKNAEGEPTEQVPQNESSETQKLQQELKEKENKYLYLYAEFETYKKRAIQERAQTLKFGYEPFARELLQVADNLERAIEHSQAEAGEIKQLLTGVQMVYQQLQSTLEKYNVVPLQTKGQKFNPEQHEAVGQEKTSSVEEGTILKELQKGYLIHGRLLRPARVVVAIRE